MSLMDLFFQKQTAKQKRNVVDKQKREAKKRAYQANKKASKKIYGKASPVVLQGVVLGGDKKVNLNKESSNISDNAWNYSYNLLSRAGYGGSSGSGSNGDNISIDGDGGSGDSSGSDSSSGNGSSYSNSGAMSKTERDKLYKMKDSNVPYYYDHDENDLAYIAASEKRDFAWGLKEEIFLYTIHDRQKHKYITSIQIDSDADDIVTTCQIEMPYKANLMDYFIPGKTAFMIMGGTFDREILFIGRVSEITQDGDSIQVTGQNLGWKFKQYMPIKFYKKMIGLPVPLAVKAIFKKLGFTRGKYHMDLWAIPNVFKYKVDEDCTIKKSGETVYNVPDLEEVVSRMKDADINKYVASRAKVNSTQGAANRYDESTKSSRLSSVILSSNSAYPSIYRKNYGVTTSIKNGEISYDPIEKMLYGVDKRVEYFTENQSGYSDYTYNDLMENIAAAIDAQFFIVDTTVCFVSFNALMAMGSTETIVKSIQPRIEYWQLEHDSYELDINQYGYYNTVIVKYKNGTVKRSFEDLVRVYDEIAITYNEPTLDYEAAQLKAQAYLAANVRDFGMQIRFNILYTGKITVASFIKAQNPLTMSESLFYVYGTSIQWSAEGQTLTCSLDCRYGPENPDNPEIPEYGLQYSGASQGNLSVSDTVSADVVTAAQEITAGAFTNDQRVEMIYEWFKKNVKYRFYYDSDHSVSATLQGKSSNCDDSTECFYALCTAAGIPCEKIHGHLSSRSGGWGHYWCKVQYQGKMQVVDVGRGQKQGIGKYTGKLSGGTLVKKNY